jgi:hypothetical protein
MKQFYSGWCKAIAVCTFIFGCHTLAAQNNLGIGTASPSASAKLDVSSTTQGLLMPRMTQSERDAISSPATGLMIFQTNNTPGFYYYTGSAWQAVSSSGSSSGADIYGNGAAGALTVTVGNTVDWSASPPSDLNFQFSSITIAGTLIVPSGTKIRCSGNVSITGTITVLPAGNTNFATVGDKGIAHTIAVFSTHTYVPQAVRTASIPSLINIPVYGGGSGAGASSGTSTGGGGGGSFAIYAKGTLTVSVGAVVAANGANAVLADAAANNAGAGGGGGGLIVLMSKGAMSIAGTVRANGGNGSDAATVSGSYRAGGGGGGGGVIIMAASATPSITGTLQVNGGAIGANTTTGTSAGSFGGAGGASGGNGGVGGVANTNAASAGSSGIVKTIVSANPENLY